MYNYETVKIGKNIYSIEDVNIKLFSYINIRNEVFLCYDFKGEEKTITGIPALKAYKRIKLAKRKGYDNLSEKEKENFSLINW